MAVKDLRARYPIAVAWPRSAMVLSMVDTIAIHHSVTPTLPAAASEAEEVAWIDKIDAYHRSRGFGGIGYHLCAFPSGRVYYVANLRQWGANVGGQNNHLYGVCLVGDLTNVAPSNIHLRAGAVACQFIDNFLKATRAAKPHNAFGGTVCPARGTPMSPTIRSYLPPTTPVGIWAYVKPVSKSVVLYQDTYLVNLATNARVKLLPAGTKLAVAAQYKTSHYLTPYSYTNKIPNGFAISATVKPPAPTCEAEKRKIAELTAQLSAMTAGRDAWKARAANAEGKLGKVRVIVG